MPRPQRCRRVCSEPQFHCFSPGGVEQPAENRLTVDEYEVIRLVDYEKKSHEQCAEVMDISRTTVTEIYERARYKIAECLVHGKQLTISGGNYRICTGKTGCCGQPCDRGKKRLKIAVPWHNGEVFQHFGRAEHFKLYDVENGTVISCEIIDTHGTGPDLVYQSGIDVLICGGIGNRAVMAVENAGIRLYRGINGNADDAVQWILERITVCEKGCR